MADGLRHRLRIRRCLHVLGVAVAALLAANGCGRYQLARFEKHAAHGDYAWIAAQPIDCRQSSASCSRLHRLKGEACLRLADAGIRPPVNYACAIEELSAGLAVPADETAAGERLRYQELLCQALIHAQRVEVSQPVDRIMAAAQELYRLSPGSVPSHYYLSTARLIEARRMPAEHGDASRMPACIRLKRTTTDVLSWIQTAERQPPPQWDRFADRYQRLAFDLGKALSAMGCR